MSKCFYHRDHDGKCAGAIIKLVAPEYEMISIDYNDEFPLASIKNDEGIIIVDFSIEPHEMAKLLEITPNVTWIDHHKTAIKKYEEFKWAEKIGGIREVGRCGAMLTWEYFHKDQKPPYAVELINDWDIWAHELNPDTTYFNAGLKIYDISPDNTVLWKQLMSDPTLLASIIGQGKIGERFYNCFYRDYVNDWGYEVEWEGHKWWVCNLGKTSIQAFKHLEDKYKTFISYAHDGRQFSVSLYTDDKELDLSIIAVKYGGGGHAGACGLQVTELPWRRNDD